MTFRSSWYRKYIKVECVEKINRNVAWDGKVQLWGKRLVKLGLLSMEWRRLSWEYD